MKKTILITGGAGYIGSHAVVAFEQAGYKTVIVDNLVNSSREALEGIEKILGYSPVFFECDILDKEKLEHIFSSYDIDGVIHFAGLKSVAESVREIHTYQQNNIAGSINLFGVMESHGVRNIVFSSSATVYAGENTSPLTEDMPLGTTNPYGTSKLVIEKLLEDYAKHASWRIMNLRYFNPIGAHPSGYIGESPQGIPNNLLPFVLDVAIGKRPRVAVYGGDYPTEDGTGVRDYIDINDLIDAHILSYASLVPGFRVYNIGTGVGVSVLEMIRMVEQVSEMVIPYSITERRPGDLALVLADATKIQQDLGWHSLRSLEESISTAWNFIKSRVE